MNPRGGAGHPLMFVRGVAMSNVMGRVMAERILGATPETLPFPVTKIAGIPLRNLKMIGMKHVIRWMKFLDYLERVSRTP